MTDAFPRLRGDIDAAPASRDGETFYILYDRAGITASRLLVSPLGLLIAGKLDGSASVLDIADGLSREYGGGIPPSEVEKIVGALDEALFLDGSRFDDFQAQADRDFRAAAVRPAGSAGSAYSDDPETLAAELDAILDAAPPPEETGPGFGRCPRGIIIPHIDYPRGAPGYGQAYSLLRAAPPPRTVVVAGTAHVPMPDRFALCEKDFATPLGPVEPDREAIGLIRSRLAPLTDLDSGLLAHRGEHSIELQAVWLRHIYGAGVRIVPLLAASVGEFLDGERAPEEAADDPVLREMTACLAGLAAGGDVMIMASADLSHVGPRFGDAEEVSQAFLAETEEADREYLAAAARGPAEGLACLARHGDRYHVCGAAPVYLLGAALPDARGRLLGYHQAVAPEMRQAVSYAAMVFA